MCISHFTAGIAVIGAERAIDIPVPSPLPDHRPPAQMRVTAFVCQCDRRLTSGTPVKPILKQKETDEEERCVHGAHDEAISWPEETPTADTCTAAFYRWRIRARLGRGGDKWYRAIGVHRLLTGGGGCAPVSTISTGADKKSPAFAAFFLPARFWPAMDGAAGSSLQHGDAHRRSVLRNALCADIMSS